MKWSWKLTRLAGIDVYVHATFFILIIWIGIAYWQAEGTVAAVVAGISFILALFSCVVLHELGHALTARRYGIQTRHITLLPIGGVAMLEKMPDDPKQEIAVALAGPAVNLVIALLIWLWLALSGINTPVAEIGFAGGSMLERLLVLNIVLAVFNLLPALPMDGGRVFRAALAMRMDPVAATEMAAKVGQGLALVLGFLGLLYNPFLLFIAIFVWIGAAAEAHSAEIKGALSGVTVGEAMLTDYKTLTPEDRLSRAIKLILAGSQKDFPVMEGRAIVGILTQTDLLKGLQAQGESARVVDWMQRDIQDVDIAQPLEKVLGYLQASPHRLITVTKADRLMGIVNLDNFIEYLTIHGSLDRRASIVKSKERKSILG